MTVMDLNSHRAEQAIENLEFLLRTGETLNGAAHRIGMKPNTVEKLLERHDRADLIRALRAQGSPCQISA